MIEHLFGMRESLSSNPRTAKTSASELMSTSWSAQMYPELHIARVEQAAQAIPMERWCGGTRSGRCAHPHHEVVPFHCLRESPVWWGVGTEVKWESLRDEVLSLTQTCTGSLGVR